MSSGQTGAELVRIINDLLATKHYEWARSTLEGIAQTIDRTGHVTLRQKEAVEHIICGRLRHDVGPA